MQKNELSLAEVRAMYFDEEALLLSPYKLYRFEYKGNRYYFYDKRAFVPVAPEAVDENEVKNEEAVQEVTTMEALDWAVGVTTMTATTMPMPEGLLRYYGDKGYDEAIEYRDERAKYGSLLHTLAAHLIIKREMDLDAMPDIVAAYAAKNRLNINVEEWADDLKQDCLALVQFFVDYNVKPLAVELSLISPKLRIAGTLDLLCTMEIDVNGYFGEVYKSGPQKGQPKITKQRMRVVAIIDFKSGRKAVASKAYAVQLQLLLMMLKELMAQVYGVVIGDDVKLYNWHPKNWLTAPGYTLVERTNEVCEDEIMHYIGLYPYYDKTGADKSIMNIQGIVKLDAGTEANITRRNINEIVVAKIDEGQVEPMHYDTLEDYLEPEKVLNVDENEDLNISNDAQQQDN